MHFHLIFALILDEFHLVCFPLLTFGEIGVWIKYQVHGKCVTIKISRDV